MLFVGLGGTLRIGSSSEAALRFCMSAIEEAGHRVVLFTGPQIDVPMYDPRSPVRDPRALELIEEVRHADGIVLASPGYHGGVSGLVKNALDYLEDTADDERPYFDGRPVGCITTAFGYQGATAALVGLRAVTHALRGWPTPYGVAVNSKTWLDESGGIDPAIARGLEIVARQVTAFATAFAPLEQLSSRTRVGV